MEIVYHIGANCTDGERLLRSLTRDLDSLAAVGVSVPGPGRYRKVLREAMEAQAKGQPVAGVRKAVLDAMLDDGRPDRVVLSNATFLSLPPRVFDGGRPFPNIERKLRALRAIFPVDTIELHLGLRNPATFIPAAWHQSKTDDFVRFMGGMSPRGLVWSEIVGRIRHVAPDMALTVWCNEDTPLIWGDILDGLAGRGTATGLTGRHDLMTSIMSADGVDRFSRYMDLHPGQTSEQERRVVGAFLDKYAITGETWEEVDLPDWDEALVGDLTRDYEVDVARIEAMPEVTVLQP